MTRERKKWGWDAWVPSAVGWWGGRQSGCGHSSSAYFFWKFFWLHLETPTRDPHAPAAEAQSLFIFMLKQYMLELTYSTVLVSCVQQSDSVTHTHIYILVHADVFKHSHCSGGRLSLLLTALVVSDSRTPGASPHTCFYSFALAAFWGNHGSAHLKEKDVTNIWDQKTRSCLVSFVLASKI